MALTRESRFDTILEGGATIIKDQPKALNIWLRKAKGSGLQSLSLSWKRRFFRFGMNTLLPFQAPATGNLNTFHLFSTR